MIRETSVLAPDGAPVKRVELESADGLRLSLMDWGGTWLSCLVPLGDGSLREVLLGCARLEDWFEQRAYLGATVGRFANRIGGARIRDGNRVLQLEPNLGSPHQLHGGPGGFDRRRWQILASDADSVTLGIHSPDGDQGFPGALDARVTYRLEPGLGVRMDYEAHTTARTPVSLTNHAYLNLDGARTDVRAHRLRIAASRYLPVDAGLIPLGQLADVSGTSFDFSSEKPVARDFLADAQQAVAGGYDHAWFLDPECRGLARPAASLLAGDGRLAMALFTSKPALQFYSGNMLAGTPARDGSTYRAFEGLALETEFLPDAPNHPEWPESDCWIGPDQTYRHSTLLVFMPQPE